MKLVLIEGPGKKEAIQKYLGKDYVVFATKGHIRDLPVNKFGVDVNNRFEPSYEILEDKKQIVKEMLELYKKSDEVYLATDPDREGEAISWHILTILGLDNHAKVRTAFNEISKSAILESISKPRSIDYNLVAAQTARRVLDRLVGYRLSPLLSRKIKGKLSAGRVQSVALKIIVEREKKINSFIPQEYWNISGILNKKDGSYPFKFTVENFEGKKIDIKSQQEAQVVLDFLHANSPVVKDIKSQVVSNKPNAPYITSSLQQDAINKLKLNLKQVTSILQNLYEGISIQGEGKVALITYIRTDSTRVSEQAQAMAKKFILEKYGEKYAPKSYNVYTSKKNAQDAHEAIRPINLNITPESLAGKIDENYLKMYSLIFNRFVASQMTNAVYDSLTVLMDCGSYGLKSSGRALKFDGFTKVYKDEDAEASGIDIPNLEIGEVVKIDKIDSEQKFTKPPVRFTEASIVKEMEDKGIGRPATYAATILTILNRNYIEKEGKFLVPTDLGVQVTDFLEKYFTDLMNIEFTADMEKNLDEVEFGKMNWRQLVDDFYWDFEKKLMEAYKTSENVKLEPNKSGIKCDKCGGEMVYREGKFGKFLACSNFPVCKNTMNIAKDDNNEKKGLCPKCGGVVTLKKSKKGKSFFGCNNYPNCDFMSWYLPTDKRCPKCGEQLYLKTTQEGSILKCQKRGCTYSEQVKTEGTYNSKVTDE